MYFFLQVFFFHLTLCTYDQTQGFGAVFLAIGHWLLATNIGYWSS
jgi:hypothetical protein